MAISFKDAYMQSTVPTYISSRDPRKLEDLLSEIYSIADNAIKSYYEQDFQLGNNTYVGYASSTISCDEAIQNIHRLLSEAAYSNPHLASVSGKLPPKPKECEHLVMEYDEEEDMEYCVDCQEVLSL